MLAREEVDLLVPQPELARQVAEAVFVLIPLAEEVHRAVLTPLNHLRVGSEGGNVGQDLFMFVLEGYGRISVTVYS